MQNHKTIFLAMSIVGGILNGCASMQTTFFTRHEDDTLCKESEHPINGVPVMVKVPTHLELKIQEVVHIIQQPDTANLEILNNAGKAIRKVEPNLRFTEKMFVVDPKRPFSGSATYGLSFRGAADSTGKPNADSGHGYLNGLRYSVDDQTITDASALLASVAPLLGGGVSTDEETADAKLHAVQNVQTTQRTIAYGLFDLSSPTFEDDVTAFVEIHLNSCSPCNADSSSVQAVSKMFKAPI